MEKTNLKNDAETYELVGGYLRSEEILLIEKGTLIARKHLDNHFNSNVLDLCCGTGLSIKDIINHPNISKALGVDNSEGYLEFARKRFKDIPKMSLYLGDAVEYQLPNNHWDIVILGSSYHHIEDNRKARFLQRVKNLLKPDGKAIFMENILPPYDINDSESYKNAVMLFYREVLSTALEKNPSLPDNIRRHIWEVAEDSCNRYSEHKTSMDIFLNHISKSSLKLIHQEKVWPFKGEMAVTSGGNYVFVTQK